MNLVKMVSLGIAMVFASLAPAEAGSQEACWCYKHGKKVYYSYGQASGGLRPKQCRAHSMGPMTPWLGGFYDAKNGNDTYLAKEKWCTYTQKGYGSGSGSGSSNNSGSSGGSSGSGTIQGSTPGKWYAWGHLPPSGGRCPAGYNHYYQGQCYPNCAPGYYGYHFPGPSDICVQCPKGYTGVKVNQYGMPVCTK